MMHYKFKFSVIVPVYNVEDYLEETIESLVHQTIGFEKNIQLILVNDGSKDGSGKICEHYRALFPENIVYVEKKNGGVSSARNEGIQYIEGKYVNFLDSDDKWDLNAFHALYRFFEKHYEETDVVAARDRFFEAKTDYHLLDYRFNAGTRIAELNNEDEAFIIQSRVCPAIIKREVLDTLRFDETLKYGEDAVFINKLILKRCRLGLVKEAEYLYRRRANESSLVNRQKYDADYYLVSPIGYHRELIDCSKKQHGFVTPFIQGVIAYDIMFRFASSEINSALNREEYERYKELMRNILSEIDDRFLLENPVHSQIERRREAVYFKYGKDLLKELRFDSETKSLYFGEYLILCIARNKTRCCVVTKAEINGKKLEMELLIVNWLTEATADGATVFIKCGKKNYVPEQMAYPLKQTDRRDGKKPYYTLYRCTVQLSSKKDSLTRIKPYLRFGEEVCPISMSYGKFVPSTNAYKYAYSAKNGYILHCMRTVIRVEKPADYQKARRAAEGKSILGLIKENKPELASLRLRLPLFKRREKAKGDIWLISDRVDNAGDNGEVFFHYVCSHKPKGVRPVFAIGENVSDEIITRLQKSGEVITFEDKRYPLFFLSAKKIISSSATEFTINPFGTDKKYLLDLFRFKYYYLQHGIACADLSSWLNRHNKNIYCFFTAGERERDSIVNGDYLYATENVALTGQARFDALYENTKKQILILPTWRRSIKESYDRNTSSVYFDGFVNTEYFKFYNSLINDSRLLEVMRRKGYEGLFCLHPIHMKQSVDFHENDVFRVNEGFVDYNKVFAESAVMVTDYSSVLFDYAYLRKPVVYAQFDKEEFFSGQIYDEGYFKYERDGFGKVCYNLEDTVNELIRLIENDCANDKVYLDRVNSFFAFNDKNNAKRILEKILEMDE